MVWLGPLHNDLSEDNPSYGLFHLLENLGTVSRNTGLYFRTPYMARTTYPKAGGGRLRSSAGFARVSRPRQIRPGSSALGVITS